MWHLASILVYMQHTNQYPDQIQKLHRLWDNLKAIYTLLYQLPIMNDYAYRPPTAHPLGPGRPHYILFVEKLACLRGQFNSWTQIASDLGVSRQTIYNWQRELGFSLDFENFSSMQNQELDVVQEELNTFPWTGETNVMAGLQQCGIYIQRWRVRESIDPINHAKRWGQRIQRRPYSVPRPNFLRHIDTNMKWHHWACAYMVLWMVFHKP